MNRRFWLQLVACFCGSFASATALGWFVIFRKMGHAEAVRYLKDHFRYLTLEKDDLAAYVDDWFQRGNEITGRNLTEFATTFLMSTDFFPNGANEEFPVRYLGFYDPSDAGCSNPFAEFDA